MKQLRKQLTKLLNGLAGSVFCYGYPDLLAGIYKIYPEKSFHMVGELVSYLFAWMSLLGASLITSERGHMNIPVVVERMAAGEEEGIFHFC